MDLFILIILLELLMVRYG